MFVEVYQVDLEFCYLHILIVVFPCGFKDFYGIYRLRKEGASCLELIVKNILYIIMYSNFFSYHEQNMAKSKIVINYYNNFYQDWHEQW